MANPTGQLGTPVSQPGNLRLGSPFSGTTSIPHVDPFFATTAELDFAPIRVFEPGVVRMMQPPSPEGAVYAPTASVGQVTLSTPLASTAELDPVPTLYPQPIGVTVPLATAGYEVDYPPLKVFEPGWIRPSYVDSSGPAYEPHLPRLVQPALNDTAELDYSPRLDQVVFPPYIPAPPGIVPLEVRPVGTAFASVQLTWATMGRVTQTALEATLQRLPPATVDQVTNEALVGEIPDVRLGQVMAESATLAPGPVQLDQYAHEVLAKANPNVRVDQFLTEITTSDPPPPVSLSQFAVETLIRASSFVQGNAYAHIQMRQVLTGHAYLRIRANEHELVGNASVLLIQQPFVAPLPAPPIANPTLAPTATVGHDASGHLAPGVYAVGYTWVDQWGETQLSPLTIVTVTGTDANLVIDVPTLPDGVIGYRLYISPTGAPTAPPIQWLKPDLTGLTTGTSILTSTTTVETIAILDRGGGGFFSPTSNTTGNVSHAFDHDFRDPTSNLTAPAPLGWKPADPTAEIVVVRSGERDLASLGVWGGLTGSTEIMPADGTGTWIFNQYPPISSPFHTSLVHSPSGPIRLDVPTNTLFYDMPTQAQYDPTALVGIQTLDDGGTIPPGVYWVAFTWLDPAGHETRLSQVYFNNQLTGVETSIIIVPTGHLASWHFSFQFPQRYAVPPVGANLYVSTYNLSVPARLVTAQPPNSSFYRQNGSPITSSAPPPPPDTVDDIFSDPFNLTSLTWTGAHPPNLTNWPPAQTPLDGSGRHWWEPDYVPPAADVHGETWHRPYGGFNRNSPFDFGQTQGIAVYDPHWRSLPSATTLGDARHIFEDDSLHIWGGAGDSPPPGWGPRTYFRHVWNQPGLATEDALITLRWNGSLDELFVNSTAILGTISGVNVDLHIPGMGARYWRTQTFRVPAAAFVVGRNVLAFKIHTSDEVDYGVSFDGAKDANGDPAAFGAVLPAVHVHALGDRWTSDDQIDLANGPTRQALGAHRPDGSSRMYWSGRFTTSGVGFDPVVWSGTGTMYQRPGTDEGPGYWGYYGWTHQPEFRVRAIWDSGPYTPSPVGSRELLGPVGPARWPPRDDGFGLDDIYRSGVFTMAIGDTAWKITVDRFSMTGIGRIGGGGRVKLGAHIPGTLPGAEEGIDMGGSREWAPGACFLMTIPTVHGTVDYSERTAWNSLVSIGMFEGFPIDADPFGHSPTYQYPFGFQPWDQGKVVARFPVNNLREIFVSAVSRRPDGGNLGKARMSVYWLDANGQVGGHLANDTEFLHGTFPAYQPATLWPYSENHFWVGGHFGTGAWRTAKAIEIRMFNHQDNYLSDPNGLTKGNEWLINVTVREGVARPNVFDHPQIIGGSH